MKKTKTEEPIIRRIVEEVLTQPYFGNPLSAEACARIGVQAPLHVSYQPQESLVYLITGENATGKSMFVKYLRVFVFKKHLKFFHSSITHRSTGVEDKYGEHFWSLIPEDIASNGANTSIMLTNGLEGARKLRGRYVLLLDEPLLGLSVGYQQAAAEYISAFTIGAPERMKGLVIVDQNPLIISKLKEISPNHIRFGDDLTLEEVIHNPPSHTVQDLLELRTASDRTRMQIDAVEKRIKEYKHK